MMDTSKDDPFRSTIRSGSIILALSSFLGSYAQDGDGPYVVQELFEGGSILICDIRSVRQFKVNDHHLKPYLTSELPDNMHL